MDAQVRALVDPAERQAVQTERICRGNTRRAERLRNGSGREGWKRETELAILFHEFVNDPLHQLLCERAPAENQASQNLGMDAKVEL